MTKNVAKKGAASNKTSSAKQAKSKKPASSGSKSASKTTAKSPAKTHGKTGNKKVIKAKAKSVAEKSAAKKAKPVSAPKAMAAKKKIKPQKASVAEKGKASRASEVAADVRVELVEEVVVSVAGDEQNISVHDEAIEAKKSGSEKAERAEGASSTVTDEAEVILTDAEGRRYCRVKECDQAATVDSYCRYHYLMYWKNIQIRKKILSEGRLERYIEELTSRYPDKYLDMLRKDLRNEKDFLSAIQELEIDDSGVDTEYEDEAQSYLEEVRGMSGDSNSREEEDF